MQLYGIRHHGPGSARSLLRALTEQQPDCVLIEGPTDAEKLLAHAAHTDMVPPVAMLVYNPKNLRQASFFPFAEFSPEWQAILFALKNKIPVRFMDLPMSLSFGLKEETAQLSLDLPESQPDSVHDISNFKLLSPQARSNFELDDPFTEIAKLAGYTDPERWWEACFERTSTNHEPQEASEIFSVILELMTALRAEKAGPETGETLLREAYMRQTIRAAQKEGFQNIAVVCGAWHTPALHICTPELRSGKSAEQSSAVQARADATLSTPELRSGKAAEHSSAVQARTDATLSTPELRSGKAAEHSSAVQARADATLSTPELRSGKAAERSSAVQARADATISTAELRSGKAAERSSAVQAKSDAALLKGLKKVKTETTWIPWSFDRLSTQSGYGAGVQAPAWYRILWEHTAFEPPEPGNRSQLQTSNFKPQTSNASTVVWLTSAAQLLRAQDIETSSASVIEAVRLAEALATMRRTLQPGIEELCEAAVAVMGKGMEKPLELLDAQLVIGDVLGAVPASLPVPPLKADFEAQARSCRLDRSTTDKKLELDLRDAPDLRKSILLHRVDLFGIHWGKILEVGAGKQGRFHEHWSLKWLPDYEIRLIEAGAWGNTVESAALHRTLRQVGEAEKLIQLTTLLGAVLKADLPAAMPALLQKLQSVGVLSTDALLLIEAVPPLAEALRYGQARRIRLDLVEQLLEQLIPRLCLQLPIVCAGVNEDVAEDIQKKMLGLNRALGILQSPEYDAYWHRALQSISQSDSAAPLLAGLSTRLLFDKKLETATQTGDVMHFRLSTAQSPAVAAEWLEGFLHGSSLLLLHHPALWNILDTWVRDLEGDAFQGLLPLLRRTFSRFPPPERGKMLDLAKMGGRQGVAVEEEDVAVEEWDAVRAKPVFDLLQRLLG